MTRTGLLLGKAPRGGVERLGSGGLCMVGKSGAGVLRTSPPAEGSAKGGANTLWGFVNGGTPHRRNDRFLTLASPEDKDFAPEVTACVIIATRNVFLVTRLCTNS